MGTTTNISWCDSTWNGWRGCEHAVLPDGSEHPGCDNCYAEAMAPRNPKTLGVWGPEGNRVRGTDAYWKQPLKWNAEAEREQQRKRVFALSLGDVFEDWQGPILDTGGERLCFYEPRKGWFKQPVYIEQPPAGARFATMDDLRRDLFTLIDRTPWLDWLLLTKRPQDIRRMWPASTDGTGRMFPFRKNVWLITSISDQPTADALIPELLGCGDLAPVLGLSCEPLLGPVKLTCLNNGGGETYDALRAVVTTHRGDSFRASDRSPLHWIICGGESGGKSRECHVDWVRSLVRQCKAANVPVFVKQLGANYCDPANAVGGAQTQPPAEYGRLRLRLADPKGGDITEFPTDLQVREYPAC